LENLADIMHSRLSNSLFAVLLFFHKKEILPRHKFSALLQQTRSHARQPKMEHIKYIPFSPLFFSFRLSNLAKIGPAIRKFAAHPAQMVPFCQAKVHLGPKMRVGLGT